MILIKKIIGAAPCVKHFEMVQGETLKKAPQGYPKDHPDMELLKLKPHTAMKKLADDQIIAPDFAAQGVEAFTALKPYVTYLHEVTD